MSFTEEPAAPEFRRGDVVSYTDGRGRRIVGRVLAVTAHWPRVDTKIGPPTVVYEVTHPSWNGRKANVGVDQVHGLIERPTGAYVPKSHPGNEAVAPADVETHDRKQAKKRVQHAADREAREKAAKETRLQDEARKKARHDADRAAIREQRNHRLRVRKTPAEALKLKDFSE